MPNSYMQMIFIDDEDNARQTNVGAAMDTDAQTWAAFKSYRHMDVGSERAAFLLDYYNRKGDLADTICLDVAGFESITNEKAKTNAEYVQIDEDYWAQARRDHDARKRARASTSGPEVQS